MKKKITFVPAFLRTSFGEYSETGKPEQEKGNEEG